MSSIVKSYRLVVLAATRSPSCSACTGRPPMSPLPSAIIDSTKMNFLMTASRSALDPFQCGNALFHRRMRGKQAHHMAGAGDLERHQRVGRAAWLRLHARHPAVDPLQRRDHRALAVHLRGKGISSEFAAPRMPHDGDHGKKTQNNLDDKR